MKQGQVSYRSHSENIQSFENLLREPKTYIGHGPSGGRLNIEPSIRSASRASGGSGGNLRFRCAFQYRRIEKRCSCHPELMALYNVGMDPLQVDAVPIVRDRNSVS
ncbi:hypothetical protein EVAR_40005_1 [Eumeta japonica]|uniref:Uncharacterized protein n=1 Tax=Eumeta variegata TaxID=151549 RepID=A0A4C1ZRB5_EUMVA|nr:hypothetical protein EVAR_40005_1 [Eumeta japonica]